MKEFFIREVQEQPVERPGRNLTKLNIHFPIRGQTLKHCIEMNNCIRNATHSHIDFSAASFQIPHITLYMGYVSSQKDYSAIMVAVRTFAESLKSFKVGFYAPYLKAPKRTYAFLDTNVSDRIIDIKRKLKSLLNEFMEPLDWNIVEEPPHITVGYIKNNFDQIETIFKTTPPPPPMNTEAIEVSFCGPYGSCLGSIRCFEFDDVNLPPGN